MTNFDARYNELMSEGLRTGLAKGIGMAGKLMTFPKRLDTGIANVLRGQSADTERIIGGKAYGEPVGAVPKGGRAEEFSDLEKELTLAMRRLRLTPNDKKLQAQVADLQKKIMSVR